MSEICNQQQGLTDAMMEEKRPLAQSASTDMLGAMSDFYRALERLEYGPTAGAVIPFLESGSVRLERAQLALEGVRKVNASNPSPGKYEKFLAWHRELDFDALYDHGTQLGVLPAHIQQWRRLEEIHVQQGPLGVLDSLLSEIASLRSRVERLVQQLQSESEAESGTNESTRTQVSVLDVALTEFSAFGRMISYVNEIEPMDSRWSKSPAASVQDSHR